MNDTPIEIREQCPYCYCLSISSTAQNFQLDKSWSAFHNRHYIYVTCENPDCKELVYLCKGYFTKKISKAQAQ